VPPSAYIRNRQVKPLLERFDRLRGRVHRGDLCSESPCTGAQGWIRQRARTPSRIAAAVALSGGNVTAAASSSRGSALWN
jgi:hypothetical protein